MSKEDVEKLIAEFRATFEREDGLIDKYVYRDNPDEETGIETLSMPDAIAEWLRQKLTPLVAQKEVLQDKCTCPPLPNPHDWMHLQDCPVRTPTPTVKEESHTQEEWADRFDERFVIACGGKGSYEVGMKNKTLYKFLREGLKSDSGHHEWKLNTWYKIDGKISICNKGFHASKTPQQALGYVGGEILAQVEVKGESQLERDKECWSDMRIVKAYHWTKEDSIELAIFSAELVIDIYEKKYPGNDRPRKAIEAAKAYLKDPTKDAADAAAYAAAYAAADAAADAARAAAYAAAYAADAADAARAARAAADVIRPKIDAWFTKKIKKLTPIQ